MHKLYIFGDSFSAGNGVLPYEEYRVKYQKNSDDLMWAELLANELNMELVNLAMGSYSNEKIIDNIISNYNNISKNDIVIIGKTFYHRFDIPNFENNKLISLAPSPENLLGENYNKFEIESISYLASLMDSKLFKQRQDMRFEFFNKLLIKKGIHRCIIWDVQSDWNKYETIAIATNNEIYDHHWSYEGHRNFKNNLLNSIIYCKFI
jgi:hypothetical protein